MKSVRPAVNDAVDAMRGLALLLIITTHYLPASFFSLNLAKPLATFLFVATGYFWGSALLKAEAALNSGTVASRAGTIADALLFRHARVWPVMAVVIALYLLLGAADGGTLTTQIFTTWPLYLAYMGNVPKMMFEGEAFPSHFWLIAAQEQLILLTCVFIALFGLKRFFATLWGLLALGVAARFVGCLLLMPDHPAIALETPAAVADGLALGLLMRLAVEHRIGRRELIQSALAVLALLGLAIAALPNVNAVYFALAPLAAGLASCALIVMCTDAKRAQILSGGILGARWAVALGQMSLSLFLTHPLVNTMLVLAYPHATGAPMPIWLLALAGPPLALAFAIAFFRVVERPIRDMRGQRGMGLPRRRPAAA